MVPAWVEFLWQSWWGKNALADDFHVKIGRFNVDRYTLNTDIMIQLWVNVTILKSENSKIH